METEAWWGKELGRAHKGHKWQSQDQVSGLWTPIIISHPSLHVQSCPLLQGWRWEETASVPIVSFLQNDLKEKKTFIDLNWKGIHCWGLCLCLLFWTFVT